MVLNGGYNFGEYYSGHYRDINVGLTMKFKGYATLAFDANLVRRDLPQGSLNQNVREAPNHASAPGV